MGQGVQQLCKKGPLPVFRYVRIKDLQEKHSGVKCSVCSGSTDCNIPMSMGIPALAVGVFDGDGEHTREEYIVRSSLPKGLAIALELISSFTQQ